MPYKKEITIKNTKQRIYCSKCGRELHQPFFCYFCQMEELADSFVEVVRSIKRE